jgi:hypothetical protein
MGAVAARKKRRARRASLDRLLERPIIDYAGALVLVLVLFGIAQKFGGLDVLGHLTGAERADLYGRLIAPLSIVASIATAGLAVYAGATGPTMTLLRRVYGQRVLKQFRGAAAAAGIAVLVLISVYVAEVGYEAAWTRWVVMGTAAFVVLRTVRVIYFYSNVLKIIDEDKTPPPPRPRLEDLPSRAAAV